MAYTVGHRTDGSNLLSIEDNRRQTDVLSRVRVMTTMTAMKICAVVMLSGPVVRLWNAGRRVVVSGLQRGVLQGAC